MKLTSETVGRIQQDATCVRNICILAHVDHGKTSLSDSLLATNGIISPRMAGKIRYLDSREDEQTRGITMESSAISLYFKVLRHKESQNTEEKPNIKEYLINLIDSPGHIDFTSEVSAASRLCDGAVVLVDVVEGVCSQTINVLRQCWVDTLTPVLVLNKIDRLIFELKMTPLEAYNHMSKVIEQVNSVIGTFYAGERMENDLMWREKGGKEEYEERDDEDLYFAPEKNNVIFASATDSWAFSISTFAKIYQSKLGFSYNVLSKTLWGDYYYDKANQKIIPGKKLKTNQKNLRPLFVSFILESIWSIYQYCIIERDLEKLNKIISKIDASVSPKDLHSKDYKKLLSIIMSQWIPVSHAVLGAVIEYFPNPVEAQEKRVEILLRECVYDHFPGSVNRSDLVSPELETSMKTCNSLSPYAIAYVSKMLSVPDDDIPKGDEDNSRNTPEEIMQRGRRARELAHKASDQAAFQTISQSHESEEWEFEEDDSQLGHPEEDNSQDLKVCETLLAFTRIYSGTLSRGQLVIVVGPKFDATLPIDHPDNAQQISQDIPITDLYIIMGRDFVRVDKVSAGNIAAIRGLDGVIIKNGTICTNILDKGYINLAATTTLVHNKPIMQIAIEPTNPMKLDLLHQGLDLLAKSDPVFQWYIDDESGELIICVAGELHLERILKDLEDRFAKGCETVVKEPVIPFREGLSHNQVPEMEISKVIDGLEMEGLDLCMQVYPLPQEVTKCLTDNESALDLIVRQRLKISDDSEGTLVNDFKRSLTNAFESSNEKILTETNFASIEELLENIVSFGPRRIGPNILVESKSNGKQCRRFFDRLSDSEGKFEYEGSVLNGFELATNEGPLAAEPMQGVLVMLERSATYKDQDDLDTTVVNYSGKVITYSRDLIYKAFLAKSPRLLLAMYTCDIQAYPDVLGKVYAVVQKRGGSVISEEMKEGTPFFTIEARIPVVEAFGFSEDIRKKTSGSATPQLIFDGYDLLDIDPFWMPTTKEELEDLGEYEERENIARKYKNDIRRRKGLFVEEKVIQNAEKQRTLKKD